MASQQPVIRYGKNIELSLPVEEQMFPERNAKNHAQEVKVVYYTGEVDAMLFFPVINCKKANEKG